MSYPPRRQLWESSGWPAVRVPTWFAAGLTIVFVGALLVPSVNYFSTPAAYIAPHLILEFLALAVSVMVFALAWNLRDREPNARVMALGWASLVVSLVGVAHTLSFTGMPELVTPSSAGKAINFWLVARLAAALGLIAAAVIGDRHWPPRRWFIGVVVAAVLSAGIWWVGLFEADRLPAMFIEGVGLTTLKIAIEYGLVALYWLAAALLARRAWQLAENPDAWLAASAWTFGLGELLFTQYAAVSDLDNLIGHVYLAVAYAMIYRGVFVAGVREPYELLDDERALFRSLIDALPDAMTLKDADGRYLKANVAFQSLVGVREPDMVGRTDAELFEARLAEEVRQLDEAALNAGEMTRAQVIRPDPVTGTSVDLDSIRIPFVDAAGTQQGLIGLHRNITEQLRANDRIQTLANFDQLTGLPNKALLSDRFTQAAHHSDRQHESMAFAVLDIDDFKAVNDTLGHLVGDRVLLEFVERLRHDVREGDTLARLDGDAFAVLLRDVNEAGAALVVQRMLDEVRHAFAVEGLELLLTATAGIAIFPTDAREYESLYQCAETALHEAKVHSRGAARFFSQEQQERIKQRLELLAALRHGILGEDLRLHYQPKIELTSGTLCGFEALVRWQHPTRGLVPPSEFVPLAEESSLILDIGRWALNRAVADAAAWSTQLGFRGGVSVNVSAAQFRHGDLVEVVEQALKDHGLSPDQLTLELTETTAMHDPQAAMEVMQRLRSLGVRLAIDDFGTGYSSMQYLKRFDVSSVKIDASFVKGLPDDSNDAAIVAAIVSLARSLSCTTCAEGVETPEQLESARRLGCDVVQGFLTGRPMPATDVIGYLTRQ